MPVAAMNHFTVLSDDLEATRRFYCDLFGFKVGWRPPFQFPGWWLYAGDDTPILHVIHSKDLPQDRGGVLDHMAFSAKDLPGHRRDPQTRGHRLRAPASARRRHLAAVLPRSMRRQGRVRLREERTGARRPRRSLTLQTLTHQPLRAGPPSPAMRERSFELDVLSPLSCIAGEGRLRLLRCSMAKRGEPLLGVEHGWCLAPTLA